MLYVFTLLYMKNLLLPRWFNYFTILYLLQYTSTPYAPIFIFFDSKQSEYVEWQYTVCRSDKQQAEPPVRKGMSSENGFSVVILLSTIHNR